MLLGSIAINLRLVLVLAVGSIGAVDAWSRPPRPTGRLCETLCGRGIETSYCRCRNLSPCDLKRCSARAVCAERYGRGVCIPRQSYGPIPAECRYPKVVGRCRAAIPRYFYNTTTRRCESFIFGGCGANPNNFRTLQECQTKCRRGARRSRTRN